MRAMILAAGYGTRLWPLTIDRAKPALPFLGRPLVGYVAEYLAGYGYGEVVVNLHHQAESVRDALGDGSRFGVRLHYVEEPEILGPGGAIDNARALLEEDTFVVINGKIVTDIDLGAALETHRKTNALATLILQRNPTHERFSTVQTHAGLITGFGGPPNKLTTPQASDNAERAAVSSSAEQRGNEKDVPLMFTGIQIMEPRIFSYIPRGVFSHTVTDVYLPAIAKGEALAAYVADGMWYELSTIPRYLYITLALLKQKGLDTQADTNSVIQTNADVRESILWENVTVEAGARVRQCVLGRGVNIRGGETVENAAVVRAAVVRGLEPPPKALRGMVRGDNFIVPLTE